MGYALCRGMDQRITLNSKRQLELIASLIGPWGLVCARFHGGASGSSKKLVEGGIVMSLALAPQVVADALSKIHVY